MQREVLFWEVPWYKLEAEAPRLGRRPKCLGRRSI